MHDFHIMFYYFTVISLCIAGDDAIKQGTMLEFVSFSVAESDQRTCKRAILFQHHILGVLI